MLKNLTELSKQENRKEANVLLKIPLKQNYEEKS